MEQKFIQAWAAAREQAKALGVQTRPVPEEKAMVTAHRALSGNRDSEGFGKLSQLGRLDLSLEALAVSRAYTALFSDEEVNNALMRLLEAGYRF